MSGPFARFFFDAAFDAQSTSVGSGKTHAAIQYVLCGHALRSSNLLYVAPTIRLLEQTAAEVRKTVGALKGHSRDVHLVHSDSNIDGTASAAALEVLNKTKRGAGVVLLLTTTTFLKVLARVERPQEWDVLLDEAFQPLQFLEYHLGHDKEAGEDYFRDLFDVDVDTGRVTAAQGKWATVQAVANRDAERAGTRLLPLAEFAQAVTNPAMRCELLPERTGGALTMATYVTPEYFKPFAQVVFLAALFEHSILFHLWRRHYGVLFEPNRFFGKAVTRNVHVEQGPLVSVGHILDHKDNTSRYTLMRHRETGKENATKFGERVIDRAVETACGYLGGRRFLLQVNDWTGYRSPRHAGVLPGNVQLLPVQAHGMNSYADVEAVAALAITHPAPHQASWLVDRTGLDIGRIYQAYRIATTYQAVGRTAIRDSKNRKRKVFLVAGRDDALFLHGLFEGSEWLGKVGELPAYRSMAKANRRARRQGWQFHPEYPALRNRRDSLKRKARKGTLSPAEAADLARTEARIRALGRAVAISG